MEKWDMKQLFLEVSDSHIKMQKVPSAKGTIQKSQPMQTSQTW